MLSALDCCVQSTIISKDITLQDEPFSMGHNSSLWRNSWRQTCKSVCSFPFTNCGSISNSSSSCNHTSASSSSPSGQPTEIASVLCGTGRCQCVPLYLKLQYVGITMETAESCPDYILHLVEACGSNVSTTKTLFFTLMHQKFASSYFSLGTIKLPNVTFKELL